MLRVNARLFFFCVQKPFTGDEVNNAADKTIANPWFNNLSIYFL